MMHLVYVLRSGIDGRFYVGMTQNLSRRLREHNNGKTKSTKGYKPWKLFFFEEFDSRIEARKRENILKVDLEKNISKTNGSVAQLDRAADF